MNKYILTTFLFLFFVPILMAQTVTVGGNTGNTDKPTRTYYNYCHSQFIYLGSEINASGEITKLQLTLTSEISSSNFNKLKEWEVRLGTTPNVKYASTYGQPFLTSTALFDGDVTLLSDNKTIEVSLNTPFNYDSSTDNLLVDIIEKSPGYNSVKFVAFNTSYSNDNRCIYTSSDSTLGTQSNGGQTSIPQIKLDFIQNKPYCIKTTEVTQANANQEFNIGSQNVELITLNAKVEGNQSTIPVANTITFDLTGTSNVDDVQNVTLKYGTSNDLSQATQLASLSTVSMTGNEFTFNQDLSAGSNYFFITFDATAESSAIGHAVDAVITNFAYTGNLCSGTTTLPLDNIAGAITLKLDPIFIYATSDLLCGSSNSTGRPLPVNYNSNGSDVTWSASVYKKSKFSSDSKITAIDYFTTNCGSSNLCTYNGAVNQKIYLGTIEADIFSNSSIPTNDNDIEGLTLAFEGTVNWKDGQWNKITFDTPYTYDKSKNLVIYFVNERAIDSDLGGSGGYYCNYPNFIVDNFGANSTKYGRANVSSMNLPATGTLLNQSPVVRVYAEPTTIVQPVELLNFTAEQKDGNTEFKWKTATETNNDYFEIEQSVDGENYLSVARLNAVGNSSTLQSYTHILEDNEVGCRYYRLKQVDLNGNFDYSKVIYTCTETLQEAFTVSPNPASDVIYLNFSKPQSNLRVSIFSLDGRKVFERDWNESNSTLTINLNLNSGVYILKANEYTTKIIIR